MNQCESEYKLLEYAEGSYEEDAGALEKHLLACANCREIVEEFREITNSTKKYYSRIILPAPAKYNYKMPVDHINKVSAFRRYIALAAIVIIAFVYTLLSVVDYESEFINHKNLTGRVGNTNADIDYSAWNLQVNLIEQEIQFIKEQLPKNY